MTTDRYFEMCQVFGDEPDPSKIPPDIYDFPDYVHIGLEIFNLLSDNFTSIGMGQPLFIGKDLTALETLFGVYAVDKEERRYVIDVVELANERAKARAIRDAKKNSKK